jgi:hypothetical protein
MMLSRRKSAQPGREIFRSGQALLSYSINRAKVSGRLVLASQISNFYWLATLAKAFSVT